MPNFGHEIKDFQYHTWKVTNWNNLPGILTGPEFEVGGWKWHILLYPFGNHNLNKISIYLEFVDQQRENADWHACVQFVLLLWNSEEPMKYVSYHAWHRFDAENLNWGSGNFYDRNKLFTPSNNRTRPLIEDGSCNITALVRVMKDPTGTLWSGRNMHFTGRIGLKSQGINTFFNSVILSLYYIRYFREAVYIASKESDKPARSIASALQKVFYQLNVSAPSVDTTELTKFFGWNTLSVSDVRKFIRILQDNLENDMKNTKADGTVSKLFVGTMKTHIKCVNVDYESLRFEDYHDDSFAYYVQETLDRDNKYNAEGYGLQVVKKSVVFESFPPILHIHLDRSEYDAQNNLVKSNNRYEFPMEIDLQKYLSPNADKSKPSKYILHGVLINVDNNGCNQYFALLKPGKSGRWYKFCDSQVTGVSIKKMLYNNDDENFLFDNAYMLIYYREADINEILYPSLPKHPPNHLHEEDFPHEKKKENNHLQILIMNEETFKNHKGFGIINLYDQRFTLPEVFQIDILKTDTFDAFKNAAATKFKIPISQIRFWIIEKQDSINFRLNDLMTDDLLDKTMDEIRLTYYDDLRFYMEVYEKPINVKENYTVNVLFPILCKRKQLPSNTLLDIYKEVDPNIIEMMDPNFTFKKCNIQNGDIICFQNTLSNKEIEEHVAANRIYSIPQFYESLLMNIVVHFKSRFGYKDPIPEFKLVLNKDLTYKSVVNQVAIHLNIDPLKLCFISVGSSGEPKSKIESTTDQTLSKLLRYSSLLYYE
ncbi:16626_t:CDS:10, partial [Gigaspora margarita]